MADACFTECIVRVPARFRDRVRESAANVPTPQRNLERDFLKVREELQVMVRVKPCHEEECCITTDGKFVIFNFGKDSQTRVKDRRVQAFAQQKFKFNEIFNDDTSQADLFQNSALSQVRCFLEGENALIFTYGASSAGKTHTMLGTAEDPGILPRSLDVIFSSLEGKILTNIPLKPSGINAVSRLSVAEVEQEECEKTTLLKGVSSDSSGLLSAVSRLENCSRESSVLNIEHSDDFYSVWVSFCEIYNEHAFDLLLDRKKKRDPLRVTEDRKGRFYVKGLREVCVHSANEALQVLLLGKQNLHFAATKLNHNSSRSHCVFCVKMIRTNDDVSPTTAVVNMISFCDLAGIERTTKTQSRGERLKEAANINTSLLVLGRCLEVIRNNSIAGKHKTIVPYRESKLTKILQNFLSGDGWTTMFVNVSPSMRLADETLQVLKFAALAQEMVLAAEVSDPPVFSFGQPVPVKQPSRFQKFVRQSINSVLSARAVVVDSSASTVSIVATDCVEEKSSDCPELREKICELEEEVNRLKTEWFTNERKIRDEVCTEWSDLVKHLEANWAQKYEDTVSRYEEFIESRTNMLTDYVNVNRKRKKTSPNGDDDGDDFELLRFQMQSKQDDIVALEDTVARQGQVIEQLKTSLKASEKVKGELQQDITKLQFEMATSVQKPKIDFFGSDNSDEEVDAEPRDDVASLMVKLDSKEKMLSSAVIEYHEKNEQYEALLKESEQIHEQLVKSKQQVLDLEDRLDKTESLLTDANERLDKQEDELMNARDKLNIRDNKISALSSELREANRRMQELKSRCLDDEEQSEQVDELRKKLLAASETIAELEEANKRMQTNENEMKKIKDRFQMMQVELESANDETAELNSRNDRLKAKLGKSKRKIDELERDLELSLHERHQDEKCLLEVEMEMKKMQDSLKETRRENLKLVEEKENFKKLMDDYLATIEDLEIRIEKAKTNESVIEALRRSEAKNDQLIEECELANYEKIEMQKQLEELREDPPVESCVGTVADLRHQVRALESDMAVKDQLIARLKSQVSVSEKSQFQKYEELESKNDQLNKEMLSKQRRAEDLGRINEQLNCDLDAERHRALLLEERISELEQLAQQQEKENSGHSAGQAEIGGAPRVVIPNVFIADSDAEPTPLRTKRNNGVEKNILDSDVDDFVSEERSVPRSRVRKMAVSETPDSARSTRSSSRKVGKNDALTQPTSSTIKEEIPDDFQPIKPARMTTRSRKP